MKILNNINNEKNRKIISNLPEESINIHYTGTMFGLGTSAFSKTAISKINKLKNRPKNKPYNVLIDHKSSLAKYDILIDEKINNLIQQYWPGELTILFENRNNLFHHLTKDNCIGFRVPTHSLLRNFIKYFDKPIISTSVNKSGQKPLNDWKKIKKEFANTVDLVIKPQKVNPKNLPSTIIKYENKRITKIREGSIVFKEIEESFSKPLILFVCTGNICRSPIAEYLLKSNIEAENLNLRTASAGFIGNEMAISLNSAILLKEKGINAENHTSQKINKDIIRKSRLILTMEKAHKDSILEIAPNSFDKVFTLSEYASTSGNIDDPFQRDIRFYKIAFNEISKRIELIMTKIRKINGATNERSTT